MWILPAVFTASLSAWFVYYYRADKDKQKLMFAIPFLLAGTTYIYLATGIHNTEPESILWSNIYHWSTFPIMAALLIAVSESLFKIKNSDKLFKMFLAIFAFSCILIFLPFSIAGIFTFIRQIVGVAIIAISGYLFVRTKVVSNLMFLISMVCFTVAGMALVRGMTYFSIFAYLMAYIFLTMIFVVASPTTEKDKQNVSPYFSLKSKLASAEQELLESEERYKKLFNSSPDAIMLMAEDGEILSVNTIVAKGFGTSVEELTGKNIHSLLPKDVDEKRTAAAKKALETGEIQADEDERQGRYFYNSFVPIFTSDGKKRIQVVARDVTKQKKMEIDIKKEVESLEKNEIATLNIMEDFHETINALETAEKEITDLNKNLEQKVVERTEKIRKLLKQKDEFIGQLGHDLKTPLTPMMTLLPIVKQKTKDKKTIEILDVVFNNVEYMKNLVVKTLKLAKINSPNASPMFEDINISEELNRILSNRKYLFDKKNVSVENKIDTKLFVNADKILLEELFENLLTNSLKYSEEENHKITINAEKENDTATISVKDNGIGMDKEQVEHIFDEFYKVDDSRHDLSSSGLGLAICKRIVEKHGGRIWAESPGLGKGATFYFTLKTKKILRIVK